MVSRAAPLTLLFGAKDRRHNNAVALRQYLLRQAEKADDAE
jgi:uncharacterized protein YeaO (DUF488 family)